MQTHGSTVVLKKRLPACLLWILCATGPGFLPWIPAYALDLQFSGQLSGAFDVYRTHGDRENQAGLVYIPAFETGNPISKDLSWDAELSVNGQVSRASETSSNASSLDLYRLKLRLLTPESEIQAGLQMINFGPAQLLRSLRWFDRVDPRDPRSLSNGVYGLRYRYTALSNANYWAWCLLGNNEPKGLEILGSRRDIPEVGGRIQVPVPKGEMGAALHTRKVEGSAYALPDFGEHRLGLDGRWDILAGLWFEAVIQKQESSRLPRPWMKMATLGMDYTFPAGNGVHVLLEHRVTVLSGHFREKEAGFDMSAFLASYPVGMMDHLTAIGTYSRDTSGYGQYLSWDRTYDHVVIRASLFSYPELETVFGSLEYVGTVRGDGAGLTVIFNH
jgi:hypothetical protein